MNQKMSIGIFSYPQSQVSPSQIIYGYSSSYDNYLLQTSDASQGQW